MSLLVKLLKPASADFPNRLYGAVPENVPLVRGVGPLLGLVVLCLIPRAIVAVQLETICTDGIFFLENAQSLDQGNVRAAFGVYQLNIYPVILAALHRLGFDWEFGGMLWGVLISSLTVLPLFGFVRRQFDDQVALLSCLLYAVHPNLIEWSPELIRCTTFFFVVMLSLYLLWRAVSEAGLVWYIASGFSMAIAACTRTEGWLLFPLLLLWSSYRWLGSTQHRGRVAIGTILCLCVIPAAFVIANLTLLRHQPQWGILRGVHLAIVERVGAWLMGQTPSQDVPFHLVRLSLYDLLWMYGHKFQMAVDEIRFPLMLGGVWGWRHVWRRRDQQPLFYICLTVAASVFVFLYYVEQINTRHFFLISLLGMPYSALGLLGLAKRLQDLSRRCSGLSFSHSAIAGTLLLLVSGVGLVDGCCNKYQERGIPKFIGQWIDERFELASSDGHAPCDVIVHGLSSRLLKYYSHVSSAEEYQAFDPTGITGDKLLALIKERRPSVVILAPRLTAPGIRAALLQESQSLGLEPVDPELLPPPCRKLIVVARRDVARR